MSVLAPLLRPRWAGERGRPALRLDRMPRSLPLSRWFSGEHSPHFGCQGFWRMAGPVEGDEDLVLARNLKAHQEASRLAPIIGHPVQPQPARQPFRAD